MPIAVRIIPVVSSVAALVITSTAGVISAANGGVVVRKRGTRTPADRV